VGVGFWAGALLLACETAFLVTSGASLWSSSPAYLAPSPAEVALRHTVGSALVGMGTSTCFTAGQVGVVPDVNVAFGIREFAAYDPLLPHAYSPTWPDETGQPPRRRPPPTAPFSVFCPAVTSAPMARRYGIGFVLEPPGVPGPAGLTFVRSIDGETLYRVPGASLATLVPAPSGLLPAIDAPGRPVAVGHPDPASWKLVTASTGRAVLRLHLTDVPGWHATVDGRPLALQRYAGVMLQAELPPGRHTVELHYWPAAFTLGLELAAAGLLVLVAVPLAVGLRRRHRPGPSEPLSSGKGPGPRLHS